MIQARKKITSFIIVSVSFFAISPCQTRWHESNLKGLDQLKVEIIVDGLENAISPKWVESYVVAKLDQYKIWIKEDQPYPLLRVFIEQRIWAHRNCAARRPPCCGFVLSNESGSVGIAQGGPCCGFLLSNIFIMLQ